MSRPSEICTGCTAEVALALSITFSILSGYPITFSFMGGGGADGFMP